jgi:membrane-bound lytic murein transglycosylase D
MKKHNVLPIIVLLLSIGCASSIKPLPVRSSSIDLDPVLSEDKTDEAVPASIFISDNLKNYDPENPEIEKSIQDIFDQTMDFCNASQDFWQKGDIDSALQSLDQAYALILNIDVLNSPKLIQQKEDLRLMISRRIQEIYASRHTVVKGSHKAIPIVINKDVQYEIDSFTQREKTFFAESLKKSGKYRPMMLEMLKEAGLPEELSWLPLVESGFKVKALSKARALGLWQFIPSTGYMYGLKRDTYIDERLDPQKATLAAIEYLKTMHRIFGDWSTVLAAYNCGEGRVLGIIRKQNINYLDNFWDLYSKLPSETARYVPRFIATVHIVNNLEKYGFDDIEYDKPYDFETVSIEKQVKLKDIADLIDVPESVLKDLNPELRYHILPKTEYDLNVPEGKSDILLAEIDSIQVSVPEVKKALGFVYHRVKFGETISTISRKYNISTRTIVKVNGISKKNFLSAGKILRIPQDGNVTQALACITKEKTVRHKTNVKVKNRRHVVKCGDSLWKIAQKYDTTVAEIKKNNKLSKKGLAVGQTIKIAGAKGKSSSKRSSVYHVRRGDSPLTIATRHRMTVSRLLKLNQLKSTSKIFPGQELYTE